MCGSLGKPINCWCGWIPESSQKWENLVCPVNNFTKSSLKFLDSTDDSGQSFKMFKRCNKKKSITTNLANVTELTEWIRDYFTTGVSMRKENSRWLWGQCLNASSETETVVDDADN